MKIIKTETINGTRYLSFNKTDYVDRSGKIKTWVWAQRPNSTRAVVIAATLGDNLVLIKEFRVPVGGYVYELPAGLVDPGESPETAARREFNEETGLTITKLLRPVSPAIFNCPGLSDEAVYMVFGEASGAISNSKHESSEDIDILLYSRAAVQMLLYDAAHDTSIMIGAKAYLVFLHFIAYGKV
jgi:ADP-ribose pyrophosphatase